MLKFSAIVVLFFVFSCSSNLVFGETAEKLELSKSKNEVTIDISRTLGPVPLVFTPGMLTDYYRPMPYPFVQELNRLNKKPHWRFGYGLGGGIENREKEPKSQEEWKVFDELIKRECTEIKQKFPGKIILSIGHMVPKWLSKYPNEDKPLGDTEWAAPWKFTVPNNYEKWSSIITRVVKIHEECRLNADYIVLDEPDWTLYASEEEAFETYKQAALAIKKVNPNIKVGALGLSGWRAKKSGIPGSVNRDISPYDHTMLKGFIDYIGKNLDLPVDFIDWHFSHSNVTLEEVKQAKEWINAAWPEYKRNKVFFTIGEGVYSSKKDYEAREKGASYFIMNYLSYADAGIQRYISTSLIDQAGTWKSGDWSFVGFFSDQTHRQEGVIRAKWNAFKLLGKLEGDLLFVTTPESIKKSLHITSSKNNNKIYILAANHPSLPGRHINSCLKEKGYDKENLDLSIKQRAKGLSSKIAELIEEEDWQDIEKHISSIYKSQNITPQIKNDLRACIEQEKGALLKIKESLLFILKLSNLPTGKYTVRKYLIDKNHSNSYRFNQKNNKIIDKEIQTALGAVEKKREVAIENHLRQNNYSVRDIKTIKQQAEEMLFGTKGKNNVQTAKETLTYFIEMQYKNLDRYKNNTSLEQIKQEFLLAIKEGQAAYTKALHKDFYPKIEMINNMKGVALEIVNDKTISITSLTDYKEEMNMLPYSVMMLELEKVSN